MLSLSAMGGMDFRVHRNTQPIHVVFKSADTVALHPRSTDFWQALVWIRSRRAEDAASKSIYLLFSVVGCFPSCKYVRFLHEPDTLRKRGVHSSWDAADNAQRREKRKYAQFGMIETGFPLLSYKVASPDSRPYRIRLTMITAIITDVQLMSIDFFFFFLGRLTSSTFYFSSIFSFF